MLFCAMVLDMPHASLMNIKMRTHYLGIIVLVTISHLVLLPMRLAVVLAVVPLLEVTPSLEYPQ